MDIANLFAQYMRASPRGRMELVSSYERFFTPDVVEALNDAHSVLLDTQRQSREVCRVIDGVTNSMDLPVVPRVTPKEFVDLAVTDEAMIGRFAEQMATLLSKEQTAGLTLHVQPSVCGDFRNTDASWHRQCPLVLEILSFLPVECTLNVAENVCKMWREWLYLRDVSTAFWLGCVQREFPENLRTLLLQHSGNVDLYESDWRTIAMMMCCTDGEEAEGDGAV